ncbi:hypothetical protein M3661_24205 [Paenibacillus sp. MER 180]|uniref:hypothetical protein n=1 Tax=unclassified Paenibacillus TaxID=185978 RepID=UPI0008066F6E|nr:MULTISPECIES: hypothetical protein [unclassified Paenibacillus]MCM3293218.1 hypothetical protein [Paenibacillus sp. MER 180]OBY79460.1 hypothetical protein BBG47_11335 [Paenibacillus sp. KS1]
MTKDEALFLLKCHAFHYDDFEHEKMSNGFLGMLRPFRGELIEDNFHELMKIIEVLADEFAKPQVNRILISCFWSICQLSRAWALYPDGMLQSNGLLSQEQVRKMDEWVDMISYAVMVLLEGEDQLDEALWLYREYLHNQEK